jgi:hypothetical protein
MTFEPSLLFSSSYKSARERFRRLALEAGAQLAAQVHSGARGIEGEELAVDSAWLGPRDAPNVMVSISGTHGQEGYAGSAIQCALLAGRAPLPEGVAMLMIHGLNPWGFSHGSRTTESNVDLNRNFVDHSLGHPENATYAALHPVLLREQWSEANQAEIDTALAAFVASHGADALADGLMKGQYDFASGLCYGGTHREWSNTVLEKIARVELKEAKRVCVIDWHTGIGDYGKPFFLCFSPAESTEFELACKWWGDDPVRKARPHGFRVPSYKGLVFYGLQGFLGDRAMAGAVVEIGTRGLGMRRALRLDLWLKFSADPQSEQARLLRLDMMDAFAPFDPHWRGSTITHGVSITQAGIDGLASWKD